MANPENLIPFKKGDDDRRNLKGRPAIVKDIKAYMKERLAEPANPGSDVTRLDALMTKLLTMAYGGNLKAMELAMAYGYGKPTQGLELSAPGGGPIRMHDFSGLSNEQLKERIEQLRVFEEANPPHQTDTDGDDHPGTPEHPAT